MIRTAPIPRTPFLTVGLALSLLALGGPALARTRPDKPAADDAPAKPEPTPEETAEIRQWVGKLGARHPAKRNEALGALVRFGPKAEMAVRQLISMTADREVGVASAAAAALGKIGLYSKEAVKGLTTALASKRDVEVRKAAAESLGRIGELAAPAVKALIETLGADDADLRRESATALGRLGEKATKLAVPALQGRLEDDEPRVRLAVSVALVRHGERGEKLIATLSAAVPKTSRNTVDVRQGACEALALMGADAKPAVKHLLAVLREDGDINPAMPFVAERQAAHDAMRSAAATALGAIGDKDAVDGLRQAAEVPALRAAAEAALQQLGAPVDEDS